MNWGPATFDVAVSTGSTKVETDMIIILLYIQTFYLRDNQEIDRLG